jgi:tRNA (cmo5U34)-methyltransferase
MASVGDGIRASGGGWSFGGHVPGTFDEHVARSIPAYAACHDLVVDLADHLVPAHGRCYDLGCSTGRLTARLAERLAPRGAEVIGIDREPGMVELAIERCARLPSARFEQTALEDLELGPADLVVSYYTLQFVPLRYRQEVVDRIYRALQPGGALVLFEKVLAPTARDQEMAAGIYVDWKRRQGYDDDEIAAKTRSLRGVLTPLRHDENEAMLRRAGFTEVAQVFRWMIFEGIVART